MCGETMCSVFVNFCAQPHCLLPSDVKNWWEVVEKLLSRVLAHMLPSSIPHLLIVRFGSPIVYYHQVSRKDVKIPVKS